MSPDFCIWTGHTFLRFIPQRWKWDLTAKETNRQKALIFSHVTARFDFPVNIKYCKVLNTILKAGSIEHGQQLCSLFTCRVLLTCWVLQVGKKCNDCHKIVYRSSGKSGILLSLLVGFSQIIQKKTESHCLVESTINICAPQIRN